MRRLRDTQLDEWDRAVSSHILRDACVRVDSIESVDQTGEKQALWSLEKLQMYFHFCKQQPHPTMVRLRSYRGKFCSVCAIGDSD